MPAPDETATRRIKDKARELGFDVVGVTPADAAPEKSSRLHDFLSQGRHGEMTWMESRSRERSSPRELWPAVHSIIMLGFNYGPEDDPLKALSGKHAGVISVYAQNKDYHDIVKKKLKAMGRWMAHEFKCELKVFVDTAPVMEKPLAMAAGLGWQGKHTNLVSRERGSWLFLGAIFTTLELLEDKPETDHCGQCRRCLDICPTQAFPKPYVLDARRCISYLTIEHKGPIPVEFRSAIGNRIYGCDDCLAVCPWNKFATRAHETGLHARDALKSPPLSGLVSLDDAAFRGLFSGSPIKRVGRDRFVRNVLIAIGNSADPAMVTFVRPRLTDTTAVVRGAAVWAMAQLMEKPEFNALAQSLAPKETDDAVRAEWLGTAD